MTAGYLDIERYQVKKAVSSLPPEREVVLKLKALIFSTFLRSFQIIDRLFNIQVKKMIPS